MKSPLEIRSAELDALFQPPHADAKTVMKPIVPVDDEGNPGIGITMNADTAKSGLLVLVQNGSVGISKPDGSNFLPFILRRDEGQRLKRVNITRQPAPVLAIRRDSSGILRPDEESDTEILDTAGFIEFWEKVAFCARQGSNIEEILPV